MNDQSAERQKKRILVVNDDVVQLRLTCEILLQMNMEVIEADNGDHALQIAQEGGPLDLLITDLVMPGIDGWKLCRLLRSSDNQILRELPILVQSATFSGADTERVAREIGANDFLPIPHKREDFEQVVTALLAGKVAQRKIRVLVVDDSEMLRNYIGDHFEREGYQVFSAADGQSALEFYRQEIPEVIILDYHLTDTTADQLLPQFKNPERNAAVIAITADPSPDIAVRLTRLGADAYVRKPFQIDYLLDLSEKVRRERSLLRIEELLEQRTRELLINERRYQNLLKNAIDVIFMIDQEGNFIEVNEAFLRQGGFRTEDVIGKNVADFIHRQDLPTLQKALTKAISGDAVDFEARAKRSDGKYGWFSFVNNPVIDPDGVVIALHVIARNIHERRIAEKKVIQSQRLLESTFEAIPDLVSVYDTEGILVLSNYKGHQPFDRQQIQHTPFVKLAGFSADDNPEQSPIDEIIAGGDTRHFRWENPQDGGVKSIHLYPVFNEQQEVTLVVEHVQDITERVRSERNEILYAKNLSQLSHASMGLAELTADDDIYQYIGDKLYEISGAILVVIKSFDKSTKIAITQKVVGDPYLLQQAKEILGGNPIGMELNLPSRLREMFQEGKLISIDDSSPDFNQQYMLDEKYYQIKSLFQYRQVHVMAFSRKGVMLGYCLLLMQAGKTLAYPDIIETFVRQASLTLERRQTELELRASEERYRLLVEESQEAIGIFQKQVLIYVNAAFCRLMGAEKPEQLIGRHLKQIIDPTEWNKVYRYAFLRQEGKEAPTVYETLIRRLDGRSLWIEIVVTLREFRGERVVQVVYHDIHQRKLAELALSESENKYRSLVESSGLGIFIALDGKFVFVNETLSQWLGKQSDDLIDTDIFAALEESSRQIVMDAYRRWQQGQEGKGEYEIEVHKPVGGSRLCMLRLHHIDYKGHKAIHGILTDITHQKTLEDQFRQAQKMEAVGTLAGGIAHDFNNLLTGIIGNISMAMIQADGENRRYLFDAGKASERAASLVRQLLTFSRKGRTECKIIDPGVIVKETIDILRETIDRRIELKAIVPENAWKIMADPGQYHQVVMNLCINARDAIMDSIVARSVFSSNCESGCKIVVELKNTIIDEKYLEKQHDARIGRYVCLTVSDNGPGMDENTQKRIFEPFFTTKEQGRGTGLGLATVFGIVKQHEGWINVFSEVGKGATFKIYLPNAEEEMQVETILQPRKESPGGSETILLVDDEEVIRSLGRAILERKGYRVLLAEDGKKALDVYNREGKSIDLVILDLTMPFLSGREVLEQIRVLDPEAKVLMSSGYSADGQAQGFEALGSSGFIAKPYKVDDLAHKVREVLDLE